jgi:hypothetical protein
MRGHFSAENPTIRIRNMITLWLKTLWENLFLRVFVVKKETRGETAALLSGSLSLTGIYLWIIVNCQLSIVN